MFGVSSISDIQRLGAPDPNKPVAALLVGRYGALGRHALFALLRMFPKHFEGVASIGIACVDTKAMQGKPELDAMLERTRQDLEKYCRFASVVGIHSEYVIGVGPEIAVEAERIALETRAKYPHVLFVAGQLSFEEDSLWNRLMHNETALLVHRRLHHHGLPMIVLPVKLHLKVVDARTGQLPKAVLGLQAE